MNNIGCYDCGLGYNSPSWIEAVIPDKIWNRIKPEGCADGCGLLCISCMAKRINKLDLDEKVPVWLCGTEPLKAMKGDTREHLDTLRTWDIKG